LSIHGIDTFENDVTIVPIKYRSEETMRNNILFQLTDSPTIMKKCAEHVALIYDELEDRAKSYKHDETIFDNILSRCPGETQDKVDYVIKCLPKIHTAILMSVSEVIAENNRNLLKLLNASLPREHEPK